MYELLWLIPALPFAGFLILVLGGTFSRTAVTLVGCGSVGLAALAAFGIGYRFLTAPPPGNAFTQSIWTWFEAGGFAPGISFHLDALSLIMILVITGIGFLIHIYSSEYMEEDDGYQRFFAYMNLFVGFMLVLVLADNLALLLLGWEGVGLCSYLLIGFWYRDPANGLAARKAFVVTRIGDTALLLGLFLLFLHFDTLNIQELLGMAPQEWEKGSGVATAAALLLLGGAIGKSAQLPLQTWLPDAMAGPTPVSALIHAATMVTAGVYLIARTHVLFELSPLAMSVVAAIGGATLLVAACSALVQTDIKRVLAYSTISQLGYMFLALGVGAWSAAMFHFVTHASFKALLFLGAGAVILALHHEQNMLRMGGLWRKMPLVFWTFLIGSASLAAIPLVGAGFYSKEKILWDVWSSELGGGALLALGIAGTLLTALYTFRMVILTFFGRARSEPSHRPGKRIAAVLVVLAVLSTFIGGVETPHALGHVTWLSSFLETAIPQTVALPPGLDVELWAILLTASGFALGGLWLAWFLYMRRPELPERVAATPGGGFLRGFWMDGWMFDAFYNALFVLPFQLLARINRRDAIDFIYTFSAATARAFHVVLRETQTGRLRWYSLVLAAGTVALILLAFAL